MKNLVYIIAYSILFIVGLPWMIVVFAPGLALLLLFAAPFAWFSQRSYEKKAKQAVRVLVADDDAISVAPLLVALSQFNVAVDYVQNGKEVVEKLKSKDYELVFLDYQMPEFTGVEALRKVDHAFSLNAGIPVIFFTGSPITLASSRMKHFEVRDVWMKGVSYDSLSEQVESVLDAI